MKLILKSFLLASAFVLPSAFGADTPLAQDTTASPQDAVEVLAPLSLERLQPLRPKSTLDPVPFDNLRLVTGFVSVDGVMFTLGRLDLNDLATLVRVSRKWYNLARPVIAAAEQWLCTNFVPRVLANTRTDYDRGMLGLFNVSPADRGFDSALALAMNSRIIKNSVVHLGAGYTPPQNTILSILLNPDSTVTDIQNAADGLENLGPAYYPRAATLYEKAANDPSASAIDISASADGLSRLGSPYYSRADNLYEKAANLYEEAAKDPRATLSDILISAAGLKDLGSDFYDRASKLYEEAAKDPRATLSDIQSAADGLNDLGLKYYRMIFKDDLKQLRSTNYDRAAELYEKAVHLYEKAANDPRASAIDIRNSAAGLTNLGSLYYLSIYGDDLKDLGSANYVDRAANLYEKAANLYEKTARHPRASLIDILISADGLENLGSTYHDRAATLCEEAAQHISAGKDDIEKVAAAVKSLHLVDDGSADWYENAVKYVRTTFFDIRIYADRLKNLGPDYVDRAADLYEEAAKDERATVASIMISAAGLQRLGPDYNDRAAKLYELAIQHPEATNDDFNTIIEKLGELGPGYEEEGIALWESRKGNK